MVKYRLLPQSRADVMLDRQTYLLSLSHHYSGFKRVCQGSGISHVKCNKWVVEGVACPGPRQVVRSHSSPGTLKPRSLLVPSDWACTSTSPGTLCAACGESSPRTPVHSGDVVCSPGSLTPILASPIPPRLVRTSIANRDISASAHEDCRPRHLNKIIAFSVVLVKPRSALPSDLQPADHG
jgi:hypothetical protein